MRVLYPTTLSQKSWNKDRITALPIDSSGSIQSSQEILIADFSKNNYANGSQQAEAEMNVHHDSLSAVAKRFQQILIWL